MGCGDSKGEGTAQAPETRIALARAPQKMKVYGDYFSSDTRAILAILKHANVDYDFNLINTLTGENTQAEYTAISPNGHIPVLVHNEMKVLSQGSLLFEWLIAAEPGAAEVFAQNADGDDDAGFKAMSSYFFKELRTNTSKLIRRVAIIKFDEEQAAQFS